VSNEQLSIDSMMATGRSGKLMLFMRESDVSRSF